MHCAVVITVSASKAVVTGAFAASAEGFLIPAGALRYSVIFILELSAPFDNIRSRKEYFKRGGMSMFFCLNACRKNNAGL